MSCPSTASTSGIHRASKRAHNSPHAESPQCACALDVEWLSRQFTTRLPTGLWTGERWFQQTADHIHNVSHRFPRKSTSVSLPLSATRDLKWSTLSNTAHRLWRQSLRDILESVVLRSLRFYKMLLCSCYLSSEVRFPNQHNSCGGHANVVQQKLETDSIMLENSVHLTNRAVHFWDLFAQTTPLQYQAHVLTIQSSLHLFSRC